MAQMQTFLEVFELASNAKAHKGKSKALAKSINEVVFAAGAKKLHEVTPVLDIAHAFLSEMASSTEVMIIASASHIGHRFDELHRQLAALRAALKLPAEAPFAEPPEEPQQPPAPEQQPPPTRPPTQPATPARKLEKNVPPVKVLVVGNTGGGKSLICNLILGSNVFDSKFQPTSCTGEVTIAKGISFQGQPLLVYNIPVLIEADPDNIARNKACIRHAFEDKRELPTIVLFVFIAGVGCRILNEDVAAWKAIEQFLQPEASKCGASIGFVVNNMKKLADEKKRNDIQAKTLRTLVEATNTESFNRKVFFVEQIPEDDDGDGIEDFLSEEVNSAIAAVHDAITAMLPDAAPIVPARDEIELERDKCKNEMVLIQQQKQALEAKYAEVMRVQSLEHKRALEQVAETHRRSIEQFQQQQKIELDRMNRELHSARSDLSQAQRDLERARSQPVSAPPQFMFIPMGGGGGGYSGGGGGGGGGGGTFNKGGQFIPGGGRAPKGGGYY